MDAVLKHIQNVAVDAASVTLTCDARRAGAARVIEESQP